MYIITLKSEKENKKHYVIDFDKAVDLAIKNYKDFISMQNIDLDVIYNDIEVDKNGDFYLTLKNESKNNLKITRETVY